MKRKLQFSIFLLFLISGFNANAQERVISGKVVSADDDLPKPGALVEIQGTSITAVTDSEGNYSLSATAEEPVIVFSLSGYHTQFVKVSGQSEVNVRIHPKPGVTKEVAAALGLKKNADELSYANQSVGWENIRKAREVNIVNSLSGKVAGMYITRSGNGVGSDARMILRGKRSILGNNEPIYIIDGMPAPEGISNISPDDIKSINVLKGPHAAAIYGGRSINGAIIVTTKNGSADKPFTLNLNQVYMMEKAVPPSYFQKQYGQGIDGDYNAGFVSAWGPEMEGQTVDHWSPDPNWPDEQYNFKPQDNINDFFQPGHTKATNIAITSGNKKTQSYYSYTYTDAAGVIPNNELKRHNINVRLTNQFTDRLSLDSRINYTHQEINNKLKQVANPLNPIYNLYRLPPNIRTEDITAYEYHNEQNTPQMHWRPNFNGGDNPYWTINRNLNSNSINRVLVLASLNYSFSDNLNLMVRSALDKSSSSGETKLYSGSFGAPNGRYAVEEAKGWEWNSDFLLTYDKAIGDDWYFNFNLGGNKFKQKSSGFNISNDGLTIRNLFLLGNSENISISEYRRDPDDINRAYAFGQFSYKNAVFLDLTSGKEWVTDSNKGGLGGNINSSIGISTVISDIIDGFPAFFNFAKLRAFYADAQRFPSVQASSFQVIRIPSSGPGGGISNPISREELQPEHTKSLEFGYDFRFFKDRLRLDFTYYKTSSENQLLIVPVPVNSGYTSTIINGGSLQNKGVELMLSLTPVSTGDINWHIGFNYARNKNRVMDINESFSYYTINSNAFRQIRIENGRPYGDIYTTGLSRDEEGRVIVDWDGLPVKSGKEKTGNYNPDWLGGLHSSLFYKNFNFSFLIDIREGGEIFSPAKAVLSATGLTEETLYGREEGLIYGENLFGHKTAVLHDGSANDIPVTAEQFWRWAGSSNSIIGELFTFDASNIRLREAVIGYSLPNMVLEKLPFKEVNLSFVGRNLFFISNKAKDIDPDITVGTGKNSEGLDLFAPPFSRSYGFSFNIGF